MKLSKFFITPNSSILNCLRLYKKNHFSTVVVIDKEKQFLGVVAEADIRNSIIQGYKLNDKIKNVFNKKPIIIKTPFTNEKKIKLLSNPQFKKKRPSLIPVINHKNQISNLLVCDEMKLLKNKKKITKTVKKEKILIIGGAGYIGSLLTEFLVKKNYNTIVYDKFIYGKKSLTKINKYKNLEVIKADTRDLKSLYSAIKKVDIVVHLGELVGDPLCNVNPDQTYTINYLATKNICNICKDLGVNKLIYVSSCSVYGANSNSNFLNEKSTLNPQSVYAKLKIFCEKAILESASKEFQPCILRLGTVFGISNRPRFDLVINILTANAYKYKKIDINGGEQWRPFVHVKDVANTIQNIIEKNFKECSGKIFNISSFNMKIISISEHLKKNIKNLSVNIINKNIDKRDYKVDAKNAKRINIIKPKYNLNYGINEIIRYFKNTKNFNFKKRKFINFLNADHF